MKFFIFLWGVMTLLAFAKGYYQKNRGFDPYEMNWLMTYGRRTHFIITGIRYFSFFTDAANGLIGFPAAGKNGNVYLLASWDGSKLRVAGTLALEFVPADARALLLDGCLYICSPGEVSVADPETMTVIASVSNTEG